MRKRFYAVFLMLLVVILSACTSDIPTITSYSVSGVVTDEASNPVSGVVINFSNNYGSVVTAANGTWSKENLQGNVLVTPTKEGYSFDPVSLQVATSATNVNFVALPVLPETYSVSGKVLDSTGQGVAGVSLTFSNEFGSVVSAADGSWEKSGLSGTVTITPVLSGWSFTPVSAEVTGAKIVNFSAAQNVVHFPDVALEVKIRERIEKADGDIYQNDLLQIESLWLEGVGVADLTGIEYVVNLKTLDIWENQVSDLTPLSQLTKLEYLYAAYNQISDITPIANLPKLVWLSLGSNSISDISSLSGHQTLANLYVQSNSISDFSVLTTIPNLKVTNVWYNPTGHIDAILAQKPNLEGLYMSSDQIANPTLLGTFTNLRYLGVVGYNAVALTDISFVANLTNLEELIAYRNAITDISPLAGLTKMNYLSISNNQITDLAALAGLTNLEYLFIYSNYISDISPLVDNVGLGSGDEIFMYYNYLDITNPSSDDMLNISTLVNRGAMVYYSPQSGTYGVQSGVRKVERRGEGRRE